MPQRQASIPFQNAALRFLDWSSNCNLAGMTNTENRKEREGREEKKEEQDWRELCERASRETDPEALLVLIEQINQTLKRPQERIRQARASKPGDTAIPGH
jgi:hypothetical protein